MSSLHDLLTFLLGALLVLGAVLRALDMWRRIGHYTTEFVWSPCSALAAVVIACLNLLLINRSHDAALDLLATARVLCWAATARAFGRAINNPNNLCGIWHHGCGLGWRIIPTACSIDLCPASGCD